LKNGVESEGWRFVAFVRLVPLFPFNILNYALGLTRIPTSHYVLTTYIAMLPGALAYTYLGYAGREFITGGEGLIQKGLLALALLALASFLPGFVRRLRQKPMLEVNELNVRLASGEKLLVLDVRSPEEFAGEQGHIDQSLNIPLTVLDDRIGELSPYMDRPVAIVCRTDKRSAKAARLLAKQGFTDLHVVRDGMTAWVNADLTVVRG
jgi:rhodanese-related sulfurtransferase